jgi:hypothetical protein
MKNFKLQELSVIKSVPLVPEGADIVNGEIRVVACGTLKRIIAGILDVKRGAMNVRETRDGIAPNTRQQKSGGEIIYRLFRRMGFTTYDDPALRGTYFDTPVSLEMRGEGGVEALTTAEGIVFFVVRTQGAGRIPLMTQERASTFATIN